jgi:hypothetical protein
MKFVSPCRGIVVVNSGLDPNNQQYASHVMFTYVQKSRPKGSVLKSQANASQRGVV